MGPPRTFSKPLNTFTSPWKTLGTKLELKRNTILLITEMGYRLLIRETSMKHKLIIVYIIIICFTCYRFTFIIVCFTFIIVCFTFIIVIIISFISIILYYYYVLHAYVFHKSSGSYAVLDFMFHYVFIVVF
jgi:hypothetical protein